MSAPSRPHGRHAPRRTECRCAPSAGTVLVGDDEPVFVVRGRDPSLTRVVEFWASLVPGGEERHAVRAEVGEWLRRVVTWQRSNGIPVAGARGDPG